MIVNILLQVRKSYKAEVEEFEKSEAFSQMVTRVSRMAGLQLDNEEAGLIWEICRLQYFNNLIVPRFETAWNLGENSPWCAMFIADDLEVFEFREDLKYFYK